MLPHLPLGGATIIMAASKVTLITPIEAPGNTEVSFSYYYINTLLSIMHQDIEISFICMRMISGGEKQNHFANNNIAKITEKLINISITK